MHIYSTLDTGDFNRQKQNIIWILKLDYVFIISSLYFFKFANFLKNG